MLPLVSMMFMDSVSRCRAAGGGGRKSFIRAKKTGFARTRHQTKARPHAIAHTWKDLSPVVAVTEDTLRTRKPFIHAVVAVSPVSPVQNTTPRYSKATRRKENPLGSMTVTGCTR